MYEYAVYICITFHAGDIHIHWCFSFVSIF